MAIDSTNDTDSKICLIAVYFNKSYSKIQPALLAGPALIGDCNDQNIANLIIKELEYNVL